MPCPLDEGPNWYGRKDSNLQVSRFVAECPLQLNDARMKLRGHSACPTRNPGGAGIQPVHPETLVTGSGFEPLSSGSEPEILAAERSRYGWEWANRTPVAGFKGQRLATNRTPSDSVVGPAGIEPAWKEPQSFDLPLIYGPHKLTQSWCLETESNGLYSFSDCLCHPTRSIQASRKW